METRFTKGVWRYLKEHKCITTSKVGIIEGCKTICDIKQYPSFDYSGAEANANARLIAAAPDLLEALEILINGFETGIVHGFENPCECQVCKAKKAIKKATE